MKERSLNRKIMGRFWADGYHHSNGRGNWGDGFNRSRIYLSKMTKTHYAAMSDLASLQDHIFSLRKTAALTLQPEVFGDDVRRRGYVRELGVLMARVDRSSLSEKIWSDCFRCAKYPDFCDEVAMVCEL